MGIDSTMALAIPKFTVVADNIATQFHADLNRVLADTYNITQRLLVDNLPVGTLFCVQKDASSLLLFICNDDSFTLDASQSSTKEILSNKADELQKLLRFQRSLLPEKLRTHTNLLTPLIVVFPASINENTHLYLKSQGIHIVGRDALASEQLATLVGKYIGAPMSRYALDYMHSRFSPESVILKSQSLHIVDKSPSAQIENFLLNSEQEYALKQDLALSDQSLPAHPYNLRLIHGSAGSGKSLVLLLRAKLLGELYPDKKILVLTHNKAINHYLKSRYKNLFSKNNNSECHPFMEWCLRQWKGTRRFVFEDEVMDVVMQMLMRHLPDTIFTKNLLLREINFIKDRLIFTEKDYLQADRSGQGYSLDNNMRVRVWRAFFDFDAELASRHIMLWADLPRLLWQDVTESKILLDNYHHILVDEAQYFAPIWFELIKKAIKPSEGQLFMVADPDQGFLNRRLSWKETGIDLRDRTFRLRRTYRSNPLILKVADEFRFNRIPDEMALTLPTQAYAKHPTSHYKAPTLLHFHTRKDEKNRLFSEINKLLKKGVPPKSILVLEAESFSVRPLLQSIKKTLGQAACMLTDPYWDEEAIRVCELNAATGIESPIVFITGLQVLFDKENTTSFGDRERHSLMVENTRKLYMGMTRASEKLVLLMTSDIIPEPLKIKEMEIPTISTGELASVCYLHT
ncbi:MAG TPA: hypothetical protein EYG68_04810 [Leucothrix mucor]|nr:hypothetical protein [Leucothrix mucor]